jgi:hypothetical protein
MVFGSNGIVLNLAKKAKKDIKALYVDAHTATA